MLKSPPQASLAFNKDGQVEPLGVLRVRGQARIVKRLPFHLLARFALKYHLSPGGLANLARSLGTLSTRIRDYGERSGEAGVIEVSPESLEFLSVAA